MRSDGVAVGSQGGAGPRFAQKEAIVEDQSHADVEPVAPQCQRLQAFDVAEDDVERIEVVAQLVAVGEERLPGVLRTDDPRLEPLPVAEGVSEVVSTGIAQISVLVALALVERDACCCHQEVMAVFENVGETREGFCVDDRSIDNDEMRQQLTFQTVDLGDHGQFAQRLHRAIATDIFQDAVDLALAEEGQLLPLLS